MTIKDEWVAHCLAVASEPAEFYSGCRKILRNKRLRFKSAQDDALLIGDSGYTKSKMTMLRKNYLHEESKDMAIRLWDRRREQAKYGSVSFTTFNHFVKGNGTLDEIVAKKSKRASVFGPCIQSVILTWLDHKKASVTVTYRTTELFKKFPADLVFIRDELLSGFNLDGMRTELNCYFANVTAHPMYFVTVIPHLQDPIKALTEMGKNDPYFLDWTIKWTARYVCEEHHRGIAKFAQAQRVKKDAVERTNPDVLKKLQKYLRDNHPGHRNAYEEEEEVDE